jgi:hypothetical protein
MPVPGAACNQGRVRPAGAAELSPSEISPVAFKEDMEKRDKPQTR